MLAMCDNEEILTIKILIEYFQYLLIIIFKLSIPKSFKIVETFQFITWPGNKLVVFTRKFNSYCSDVMSLGIPDIFEKRKCL